MKRLLSSLILPLTALLLAVPAFAGTVYAPYAANVELGGVTYETRVWVANADRGADAIIEYLYLPIFRDGTDRDGVEPTELVVPAGDTITLAVAGSRGMLEIFAPEEVQVHARLVATHGDAEGQGFDLPILSSDNVLQAGGKAHLLGWERLGNGDTSYTNFGLVNMGDQIANCLVDVIRIDGVKVVEAYPITVNALSHNQWPQALGIAGVTEALGWRAIVTCDQEFYSYAVVNYPATSRLIVVTPSASGRSQLERPLDGGVSTEFDYLSDLPIASWSGLEIGPFLDRSGIDFHPAGGGPPVGGIAPIRIQGVTYEKGLSFYPRWSVTGYVEYQLNGEYAQFNAIARVDDFFNGRYEWAVVENDDWRRLERPSDGFRGVERSNPIRVGSAMTFQVKGDGVVLYQSPEVYAYGDPVVIELDVRGVNVLRFQAHPDGTEQLGAPHRNGLSSARLVKRCPWLDMIDFADAKLFLTR